MQRQLTAEIVVFDLLSDINVFHRTQMETWLPLTKGNVSSARAANDSVIVTAVLLGVVSNCAATTRCNAIIFGAVKVPNVWVRFLMHPSTKEVSGVI